MITVKNKTYFVDEDDVCVCLVGDSEFFCKLNGKTLQKAVEDKLTEIQKKQAKDEKWVLDICGL